ncbi:hypothetical protein [Crocosphaera chwakensis]|uniref:Uncharacterized protein n=1 Tax=Crocosphaera chwakensis CCY0110 TaxID=391612 RepID=A3IRX7_9CHRO|nr:hypothetical protein [Crocosphaera chwakensis]EAZ90828.1 hypothetical protein CY0110_30391 [Crocosphaera chwakensis CCY0110]
MMLLSSKKTPLTVQVNLDRQTKRVFDNSYCSEIHKEQDNLFKEKIIINNIEIPIKFSESVEKFLPSAETMSAWYLAHYGVSSPLDLEPKRIGESLEKLAAWWVSVSIKWLE